MDPVRILYLSDTGGPMGGAAASLVSLVKRLDRERFELHALLGSDGDFAEALRKLDVDVGVSPLRPIVRSANPFTLARCFTRLGGGCRAVLRVAREKQIDIIHANDNTVVFFAVVPSVLRKRKALWHVRSPVRRLGVIGSILVNHSDAIVFCSEANAEPFRRYFAKASARMHTVYEGVDIPALAECARTTTIRQDFHLAPDVPLAGMVGRITRIKGQDEFLKAAVVISELQPRARYLIVGAPAAGSREALEADRAYEIELRRLARKLQLEDKVIFTGHRGDVPGILKELAVLVVPSRREGLGLVALEAMALGVPVVASNVGGLPEIIEPERTGLLVPPSAAGAIGMAVGRLLANRNLARRLAEAARQEVEARFTADEHARSIARIYNSLMGR